MEIRSVKNKEIKCKNEHQDGKHKEGSIRRPARTY